MSNNTNNSIEIVDNGSAPTRKVRMTDHGSRFTVYSSGVVDLTREQVRQLYEWLQRRFK